jgi:hypothetical protein
MCAAPVLPFAATMKRRYDEPVARHLTLFMDRGDQTIVQVPALERQIVVQIVEAIS